MNPERFGRIGELYHEALTRAPEERASFLDRACAGDEELRNEVVALLEANAGAGTFLGSPAIAVAAADVAVVPALSPGTRIGPYEVRALLGRGGMGEVYRAHDERLGRDVAIKLLPQRFSADGVRAARLKREARLLAALNHPNIASLYGIEELHDQQVLVMELVEGTAFDVRLASSPLPLREALAIAEQLVDALEAAHERGVVHRDLKPANITIRPDGTVKVLDFGLAKAYSPSSDSAGPAIVTDEFTVVGTASYMSPEQVRGVAIDTRTDVWAFACVLYEMLTGRRAFVGETSSDVIAAVLERAPDWEALSSDTPPSIRRLLRRCLEKDPGDRLRHIADARLEIRDAGTSNGTSAVSSRPAPRSRAIGALALAAVALLAGLAGWSVATRSSSRGLAGVIRLSIPSMEPPGVFPFGVQHLAISADGSRVAYASGRRLWIRRMDAKDPITLDEITSNPFFSPDDEWVGFFAGVAALKKVAVRGGAAVTIAVVTGRPTGATWGPGGTIVFATTEGLFQVSDSGGDPALLMKPDPARKERAYTSPCFMPGGDFLLFTIVPDGPIEGSQIAVLDLKSRTVRRVLRGATAARYISTGHLVYASRSTLNAIGFDRATLRTRGEGVSLSDVQIAIAPDNGLADFALSDAGTLIFIAADALGPTPKALWWVDRRGREEPLPLPPGDYEYARISPDGSRLALDVTGPNRDIWVSNGKRPGLTRLTSNPGEDILPVWSPSGRIFFGSLRNGNSDVYSVAPDGATQERVEFAGPGDQMPMGFTPDGAAMIVNENFRDVSVLSLGRPATLTPLLHSDANEWLGEVSPDGNWIAYESDESGGQLEIFVRRFPDVTATREKVSIDGGRFPMWSRNGTGELFYVDPNGAMMAVSIRLSPSLLVGGVTKLFDLPRPPPGISGRRFDISPVDGRFLVIKPAAAAANRVVDISVVLNWFDELRRLMPDH